MNKKIKILFSFLVICLVLVGCGKSKDKKSDNQSNEEEVKTGQSIEIKVDANENSGYSWIWELTGDDNVVISYTNELKTCQNEEYCGESEIYTLTATNKGKSTFKLNYTDNNDESNVISTAIYEVNVDKDLNIAETHTGSYFNQ